MLRIRFYCGGADRRGTEVSPDVYREVMEKAFLGFTMFRAEGNYQGVREPSYVFEVVTEQNYDPTKIGKELARVGNQTEVMVTTEIVNMFFVSGKCCK